MTEKEFNKLIATIQPAILYWAENMFIVGALDREHWTGDDEVEASIQSYLRIKLMK